MGSPREFSFSVYPGHTTVIGGICFPTPSTPRLDLALVDNYSARFIGSEKEVPKPLLEAINCCRSKIVEAICKGSRRIIETQLDGDIGYKGFPSKGKVYISPNP